jgi:hypothetical protein
MKPQAQWSFAYGYSQSYFRHSHEIPVSGLLNDPKWVKPSQIEATRGYCSQNVVSALPAKKADAPLKHGK